MVASSTGFLQYLSLPVCAHGCTCQEYMGRVICECFPTLHSRISSLRYKAPKLTLFTSLFFFQSRYFSSTVFQTTMLPRYTNVSRLQLQYKSHCSAYGQILPSTFNRIVLPDNSYNCCYSYRLEYQLALIVITSFVLYSSTNCETYFICYILTAIFYTDYI